MISLHWRMLFNLGPFGEPYLSDSSAKSRMKASMRLSRVDSAGLADGSLIFVQGIADRGPSTTAFALGIASAAVKTPSLKPAYAKASDRPEYAGAK